MEPYIRISNINDFLYSPRSLYLHSVYESFAASAYKADPQVRGTILHETVERGTYSNRKRYLTALPVFSEAYGLVGKIDIYDRETGSLIERKTLIQEVRDGYRFQLYAQYFAMLEGGYPVRQLFLHSLTDNKRYPIPIPDEYETERFARVINAIRTCDITVVSEDAHSLARCEESIYGTLTY